MTPQEKALLETIGWAEGTSTSPVTLNAGYDIIVSGVAGPDLTTDKAGPEAFTDYSDHPFVHRRPKLWRMPDIPAHRSSASGRYQVLYHFWVAYKSRLHLPDFSPPSQDAVALRMMSEVHAQDFLEKGDIAGAIRACSSRWASLPGSTAGQPTRQIAQVLEKYQAALKVLL